MGNYIEIDISKNTFDVHYTDNRRDATFNNTDIQMGVIKSVRFYFIQAALFFS